MGAFSLEYFLSEWNSFTKIDGLFLKWEVNGESGESKVKVKMEMDTSQWGFRSMMGTTFGAHYGDTKRAGEFAQLLFLFTALPVNNSGFKAWKDEVVATLYVREPHPPPPPSQVGDKLDGNQNMGNPEDRNLPQNTIRGKREVEIFLEFVKNFLIKFLKIFLIWRN